MPNEIAHYEGVVNWSSGLPVVEYSRMLTKDVITQLPIAALSMPYQRTEEEIFLGEDIEFEGLTNAEVMDIRMARRAARGDNESYKIIKDRVLGKPKQEVVKTELTMSYSEYLDKITQDDGDDEEFIKEVDVNGYSKE